MPVMNGANFWFAGMPQRRCLRSLLPSKPSPTHRQIGCIFNWNSSHLQGKALSVEIEPTASWLPPFHPPCLLKRNPPPQYVHTHPRAPARPSQHDCKEQFIGRDSPFLGSYSWASGRDHPEASPWQTGSGCLLSNHLRNPPGQNLGSSRFPMGAKRQW